MVTGAQMQTVWTPWIRDLAETLEPCLLEVKCQGELRLWHPEPLACGSLLHATIHWENRWATTLMLPQAMGSKRAWETFGSPNRWVSSITQYPSATPGINQQPHPPPTDWSPLQKTKQNKTKLNNKQWNWKLAHSRGVGFLKVHQRQGEG
jgi:hypothetical protein